MEDGQVEKRAGEEAPFATRALLLSWLSRHGLGHVTRLGLEAVAPELPPALWPQLRAVGARRRLLELGSDELRERSLSWLPPSPLRDALLRAVWRVLEAERVEAERARGVPPPGPPRDPRALSLQRRLLELRARIPPSIAPRLLDGPPEGLRPDGELPGFRFRDARPYEMRPSGSFSLPEARLVFQPSSVRAECTCRAGDCVHVLAAVDGALLWLSQDETPAFLRALDELARPPWERTLRALDDALTDVAKGRGGVELTWRIAVDGGGDVVVTPWLTKTPRKGPPGPSAPVSLRRLRMEHGATLSPVDARILALLPDDGEPAPRAALDAMIAHPRVVSVDAPERPIEVERATVGLVADERHGSVRVSAGLEGTAFPPALAERVRRATGDEVLSLWDGRRLTLLDVLPELRTALQVLSREGNVFPQESQPTLLPVLARWATRIPVVMPRSVMGESAPVTLTPVLRLAAQADGGVEMQVRIRPLAGAVAVVPGEGARDVHVRRGEKAFHGVRDLAEEIVVARRLCQDLPLATAEKLEDPFHFHLPDGGAALDLLSAAEKLEPTPELEWVGTPLRNLGVRGAKALRVTLDRRQEWFGVLGGLSVEGERVELARLLDSARRKDRFVRVDVSSYVELSEALREHLQRLLDHARPGGGELSLGYGAALTLHELERDGATVDADEQLRALLRRVEAARAHHPEVPSSLLAELRPYQLEGFRFLSRLAAWGAGAVLADDMGLGKTVQTLSLLLERAPLGPSLVVAPTSVVFNWQDEAARFAPSLRLVVYADAEDRAATVSALQPGDVLVISYGLLVRDALPLATTRFATIVFDEAQNLKNAATRRFRAARALSGDFRVALSGTPVENHLGELWSLFALVFPALLGGFTAFRKRFAAPIEKQLDPDAAPALARVIAPFLLRRTKSQVETELPRRTDVRVPVVLSSAEWELYEDTRLATLSDLESRRSALLKQERHVDVLAALTRLRLLASHPRLFDARSDVASSKLARLLELVEELRAEGQRSLVFSQFTSHLALVRQALDAAGIAHEYLDGSTPQAERRERVRSFQEGEMPLFLLSLKAAGVGLNLTAATNVVLLDPWWNPAVEDQASDRAHRLGQTRPVTVYRLVALGTIEEKMLALHETKRSLVARVLDGQEAATKVSTEELMELLATRRAPL